MTLHIRRYVLCIAVVRRRQDVSVAQARSAPVEDYNPFDSSSTVQVLQNIVCGEGRWVV
jgi:hypothetical protein